MGIQLGGLGSGLPVSNIISQLMSIERRPLDALNQKKTTVNNEQTQYTAISAKVADLQTALKALTNGSLIRSADLFKKNSVTSSDATTATATADSTASSQAIALSVTRLATNTKAISTSPIGQVATGSDTIASLSGGRITTGNFTLYVNGAANTISVGSSSTVNDVLTQISGIGGAVTGASIVGGQIQVDYSPGTTVRLGGTGDTSNFLDATGLKTATPGATSVIGSSTLSLFSASASVEDNSAAHFQTAVTAASSFKIGGATFSTTGKTLQSLVNEINSSTDAGVIASFNSTTNKLQLVSKTTGSGLITLQDVSGNFLRAAGLIDGSGDSTVSQTAGLNAQFTLNGATLSSASNTVSSTVTGLDGVTLNLLNSSATPVTLTVAQDSTELKTALNTFISKFNSVISLIDTQTDAKTGTLKGDSSLRALRNVLRQTATSAVAGLTTYTSLPSIGISTGPVSASGTASSALVLDTAKLDAALAANPDLVRTLSIGATGILTKLQTITDSSLNTINGIFAAHTESTARKIKDLNTAIDRSQLRLDAKQKQLTLQFSNMDSLISRLQSQGSAISSLSNNLNSSR